MIAAIARLAVVIGVPERMKRAAAWAAIAVATIIIVGVVGWRIYAHISDAGGAKVQARIDRRDAQRRIEARADERAAQAVTSAIGAAVARRARAIDAAQAATTTEIRDAFDAVPPAAAGSAFPAAPVERLRAAINSGTERANRAADAADARR